MYYQYLQVYEKIIMNFLFVILYFVKFTVDLGIADLLVVYTHPALRIPKILHYNSSSPVNFIPPTRKRFTSHFYNRMLRLYFQPCHRSVLSKILHQATGYPWMGVFHWCQKRPTVTTKASRLALHPPVSAELIIWKVGKSAWYVAHFWKLCPSNYKQH